MNPLMRTQMRLMRRHRTCVQPLTINDLDSEVDDITIEEDDCVFMAMV
jgi:hypothetical protein